MNIFKINKKGFMLGEETLKIIVAVICIIFLVYILLAVYNSNTSVKKIEDSKEILNRTEVIISHLGEGEIENQDIPNPEGWHMYSFIEGTKPNSCLNENCVCICDNVAIKMIKSQEKKCDEKGVCLIVPSLSTLNLDLEIRGADNVLFIGIKKQSEKIMIGEIK